MSNKRRIRVVAAQIERDGRYLITQRKPTSSLPLLWEFPGGRVEENERDEDAIVREIKEDLSVHIEVLRPSVSVTHDYPAYTIDFNVYHCRLVTEANAIQCLGVHDARWVLPSELDHYEFPGADQATVELLLSELDF